MHSIARPTYLKGEALLVVAVTGALPLPLGIVNIPLSSNIDFPLTLPLAPSTALANFSCDSWAALPPIDLGPRESGPGRFFFPPAPGPPPPDPLAGVTIEGIAGVLTPDREGVLFALPAVAVMDTADNEVGTGAGLCGTRDGPRIGCGSGS
jgi:hypothetical protein